MTDAPSTNEYSIGMFIMVWIRKEVVMKNAYRPQAMAYSRRLNPILMYYMYPYMYTKAGTFIHKDLQEITFIAGRTRASESVC